MSAFFFLASRKSFYHRSIIPRRLRPFFKGRIQYWRSLRTENKDTARLRSSQVESRVQRVFVTLKNYGEAMTKDQVEALISKWMESELEEAEDYRAVCGPVSDDYREGVALVLSDQFEEATEALLSCNYRKIEKEADELLKAAGLPLLDHDGADFGRLCRRLLRAKQEVLRIEADRWEGVYRDTPKAALVNGPATVPVATVPPIGKPFSEIVKLYFSENTRATRTDAQVKSELERFISVTGGGDRPVTGISKADCRDYKDDLLQKRGLSLATRIKHLSSLSGLFKWSEAQGYIPDGANPVKGLAPNKRQAKKQAGQRRPFTDEELLKVFGSQEFIQQREDHPERYWLTLICLFQICRREEAGQLNVSDIGTWRQGDKGEAHAIPFLNITDEGEGQGLKNEGSKRKLPIHFSLVKLGFLEYVNRTKEAGHVRLFPQLKKGANGYSDAVGKFFSRLVTKAGLIDPALVLHSLRHGGIYKLHAAGAPHNVVEVLAGHAASGVHGKVYEHRELLPMSLLQDGLERLRYQEVMKALEKIQLPCL